MTDLDVINLQYILANTENGDQKAVKELHGMLAKSLREGTLSAEARSLLADMHQSIAQGVPADTAMLTKPLPNRATNTTRDERIYSEVRAMILDGDAWSMKEIYTQVGEWHGLNWSTTKNIYLARRKKLRVLMRGQKA